MNGLLNRYILGGVTITQPFRACLEPIKTDATTGQMAAVFARLPNPAILETLQATSVAGRYSVFAANPIRIISQCSGDCEVLDRLGDEFAAIPRLDCSEKPFVGGWIGHISYEGGLARRLVPPRGGLGLMPKLRFGLYDHLLLFDHMEHCWWAAAIEWPATIPNRTSAAQRLSSLRAIVKEAENFDYATPPIQCRGEVSASLSRDDYQNCVGRILEHIRAGDIYQANLAQRFRVHCQSDPADVYASARTHNPSAFSAYLSWGDCAIISSSPELFLELRGDRVITRPIKGTRPRRGIEPFDRDQKAELCASEKDRAELNMIVDLLRNDLGRVCSFGSVHVNDSGSLEEHPTVFHRVATVEGRLASGRNWLDLLKATFPGGSIVGAPKIRAMQIIRELEPFSRGPYCGAIGWIGLDGNMTFNVAIRTMTMIDGEIEVSAGGGIVAESDPESEYAEVLAKAAGMFASLNVSGPVSGRQTSGGARFA